MAGEDNHKLSTLSECMAHLKDRGFTTEYAVNDSGLVNPDTKHVYNPEEVLIDNFYRFEGVTDPGDMSILYAIITTDNQKGILIDAYGAYQNEQIGSFIKKVEAIHKDLSKK